MRKASWSFGGTRSPEEVEALLVWHKKRVSWRKVTKKIDDLAKEQKLA